MLSGSVASNVALGLALDRTKVLACLQAANLWAHVQTLPQGMDTLLGHNANQLSGGQRQRLAIARALYKDAPILILDEATEGLAPLIREEIWQCLTRLRQAGQTLVVVDKYVNRLVQIADRHLILERGSVAWHGSSAELDQDRSLWHRYLGV